jgi:hypothetical protein
MPLTATNRTLVTEAFGLAKDDVELDVILLELDGLRPDEVLVWLQERYGWPAGRSYHYLESLRRLLLEA